MKWTSALAIYALFWAASLFVVLPFHNRRDPDAPIVPGQADGAPTTFSLGRVAIQVTLVSAAAFGIYYLNYVSGFISLADINPLPPPPPR
jgi:predicted secreted protein